MRYIGRITGALKIINFFEYIVGWGLHRAENNEKTIRHPYFDMIK